MEATEGKKRELARTLSSIFAKVTVDPNYSAVRPTLIYGLLYFQENLDIHSVRKLMIERLISRFPRFRSKVVMINNKIFFEELSMSEIDINYHIQEINATNWSQHNLDHFMSSLYRENKLTSKPMWIFYILNNLSDGRSCLMANIDHCIWHNYDQSIIINIRSKINIININFINSY